MTQLVITPKKVCRKKETSRFHSNPVVEYVPDHLGIEGIATKNLGEEVVAKELTKLLERIPLEYFCKIFSSTSLKIYARNSPTTA